MILIKNVGVRRLVRVSVPFILIPLLAVAGTLVFDVKRNLFVSMLIAVLALLLFYTGFESKTVGSRRMVIVAVMTALCFVGRFIPFLKPMTALKIIAAVYLGGEAGFLVGSLSAVLSNFYFGQGPWTAFQMLAWGLIGLFAGVLSDPIRKSRVFRPAYGVLSGVAYSMIMDIWTVLWYNGTFGWKYYLAAITTALPYTLSYAVSNVVFLVLLFEPFGEKLGRIKKKYGV